MSADQPSGSPQSLSGFLNNFGCFQRSTAEFSEAYIANAIIEILYAGGSHLGSGLLLTQDGYFLTSAHCVYFSSGILKTRLADGRIFSGFQICALDPLRDIALCKLFLPEGSAYHCFKFYFACPETGGDNPRSIIYLGRRDGGLTRKNGVLWHRLVDPRYGLQIPEYFVRENKISCRYRTQPCQHYDHYPLTLDAEAGDSGGIIVTTKGALVGILNSYNLCSDKKYATCARLSDAIPLIWEYVSAYIQKCS